mmetsp:Transcript_25616/g.35206  ORF Transcript_25616/g.35206 Transcript_25616/m.35206 type:complete len:468 (+) Transcript_25616:143-1546(+)
MASKIDWKERYGDVVWAKAQGNYPYWPSWLIPPKTEFMPPYLKTSSKAPYGVYFYGDGTYGAISDKNLSEYGTGSDQDIKLRNGQKMLKNLTAKFLEAVQIADAEHSKPKAARESKIPQFHAEDGEENNDKKSKKSKREEPEEVEEVEADQTLQKILDDDEALDEEEEPSEEEEEEAEEEERRVSKGKGAQSKRKKPAALEDDEEEEEEKPRAKKSKPPPRKGPEKKKAPVKEAVPSRPESRRERLVGLAEQLRRSLEGSFDEPGALRCLERIAALRVQVWEFEVGDLVKLVSSLRKHPASAVRDKARLLRQGWMSLAAAQKPATSEEATPCAPPAGPGPSDSPRPLNPPPASPPPEEPAPVRREDFERLSGELCEQVKTNTARRRAVQVLFGVLLNLGAAARVEEAALRTADGQQDRYFEIITRFAALLKRQDKFNIKQSLLSLSLEENDVELMNIMKTTFEFVNV